jgi:hypothetical protein
VAKIFESTSTTTTTTIPPPLPTTTTTRDEREEASDGFASFPCGRLMHVWFGFDGNKI